MSGDLLTLRMMVVSEDRAIQQQWRQGVGLASIPIEFSTENAETAVASLQKGGFDIVVIDAALAIEGPTDLINAARQTAPAPLLAMLAPSQVAQVDGGDLTLPMPTSLEETRALVEKCAKLRLPKRVLVVDDSGTMRSIVRKILSGSRFQLDVSEAGACEEALNEVANGHDLTLLDCNMPGTDGFDTLAQIRQIAPRMPVVMMTATEDEAMGDRARASGATAFIRKPFYPADIDAVIIRIYGGLN
jgi:DNA-binding response OmpR family regulator